MLHSLRKKALDALGDYYKSINWLNKSSASENYGTERTVKKIELGSQNQPTISVATWHEELTEEILHLQGNVLSVYVVSGRSGVGKSTMLYWLSQQFLSQKGNKIVPVLIQLSEHKTLQAGQTFIDLVSPNRQDLLLFKNAGYHFLFFLDDYEDYAENFDNQLQEKHGIIQLSGAERYGGTIIICCQEEFLRQQQNKLSLLKQCHLSKLVNGLTSIELQPLNTGAIPLENKIKQFSRSDALQARYDNYNNIPWLRSR